MDELKIKTPTMRGLVGRAVTKYLKKKGIDVTVSINDIDGVTSSDDNSRIKVRADIMVTMSTAQLVKFLD